MTVLKSGGIYNLEYLDRLAHGIKKHAGRKLYCLSDIDCPNRIPLEHGWPGWWSKMELFRPDIKGRIFYLDLDTVICGDIRHMLKVDDLVVLRHVFRWKEHDRVGSGMMMIPEDKRPRIWQAWLDGIDKEIGKRGGDQEFLRKIWKRHKKWQNLFPGQVFSIRVQCQGQAPPDARVVYYHGKPKPHENDWKNHLPRDGPRRSWKRLKGDDTRTLPPDA